MKSTPDIQTHRPGALKQQNKTHKHGRHRSKGQIDVQTKGKTSIKVISKKKKRELNREQRRHQALQIRQKKRDEVLQKKRSVGSLDHAPFLVCVLPLNKQLDSDFAVSLLTQCDEETAVAKISTDVTHICVPRFKQKFSFVSPPKDNDLAILDTLKISDTVLLVVSAASGFSEGMIDEWGHNILLSSLAQGLPTPIVAITDLESVNPKKRNECKQEAQKIIAKWLPDEKLVILDKSADAINLLRKIGSQKQKKITYRDRRPHLYAEIVDFVPDSTGTLGTLKITGYLRGCPLSVNSLIHLPGLGDFQMSEIDKCTDPYQTHKKGKNNEDSTMNLEEGSRVIQILQQCDPSKQESLDSENIPDVMDAEQTWPTEEELHLAAIKQKIKKVKKVPKGWSDYQAAWIPDDDAEEILEQTDDSDEEEQSNYMDVMSEEESEYSDAEELGTATESEIGISDQQYDQNIDFDAEKEDLETIKAAKSDMLFPDEIDTPQDTSARIRFQKYRGLESFRTSPWNLKENLPSDYARIFQFENFDRTRKRILKSFDTTDGALPGWYITIHVKNVSQMIWSAYKSTNSQIVLIGLYPHEHKMSVVNVALKRTTINDVPMKSKERLIFQCGFRRFIANPIFSQHTNGNKHKYERFFQPESTIVATFYAPIQYPPAPVLCYKEINSKLILVATGSLLSCNPDRLVIKRAVLSGHLLKVHKRSAVVRFMFFNREDINYFKPCKLRTKYGRIGHIKEPLGTHGHMKCVFDGQLKSQDTILLNLYKRIFPKWTYEECIVKNISDSMEI